MPICLLLHREPWHPQAEPPEFLRCLLQTPSVCICLFLLALILEKEVSVLLRSSQLSQRRDGSRWGLCTAVPRHRAEFLRAHSPLPTLWGGRSSGTHSLSPQGPGSVCGALSFLHCSPFLISTVGSLCLSALGTALNMPGQRSPATSLWPGPAGSFQSSLYLAFQQCLALWTTPT